MSVIWTPGKTRTRQPQGGDSIENSSLLVAYNGGSGSLFLPRSVAPTSDDVARVFSPRSVCADGLGAPLTSLSRIAWQAPANSQFRVQDFTVTTYIDLADLASGCIWQAELRSDILVGIDGRSAGNLFYRWYTGSAFRYIDAGAASGLLHIQVVAETAPRRKSLYINGVLVGEDTFSSGITYSGTRDTSVGYRLTPTEIVGADFDLLFFSFEDRAITDAEAVSRAANPWQIFKPQQRTIFLPTGGTTITADGVAVDDVTVSSSAESSISGDGSVSVDAVSVSSAAAVEVSADGSITLDGATLSSEAAVDADASAEIALDAVTVDSDASVAAAALDASADIQIADATVSALASALAEAQSTIALDGATISSEVVTEAREASVEITLDGFTVSSVIGDQAQTGGGGGKSRPKRPTDWNPTPYERKGLDKISEAARKRRLIEAARVEDEFLLEAVQKLLVEAA